MRKGKINFVLLKTSVRGQKEEIYNFLMEDDENTIVLYPLTQPGEVLEDKYKNIVDILKEIVWCDELYPYFHDYQGEEADKALVGLLKGTLKVEDLPDYIELEGFEGLY